MDKEEIMNLLDGYGYRHERECKGTYKVYMYENQIEELKKDTGLNIDVFEIHRGEYRFDNYILMNIEEVD